MPEEIQRNFKLAMSFRQNAVFCLETMLSSKGYINVLNNTREANVFNLIGNCLYSKALIEIRKILEPSGKDKKANISSIIKYIEDNKAYFADKHYKDSLGAYITDDTNITSDIKDFIKKKNEEEALEAKDYCEKQIDLIIKMWYFFWKQLDNKYKFIRENRDFIVHSLSKEVTTLPSISKLYKVINIITWFMRKIDFIINNNAYGYQYEKEQFSNISEEFWSHIK